MSSFAARVARLRETHEELLSRKNRVDETWDNGIFLRYSLPVLTAAHVPIEWRYDLNEATNPHGLERLGVNAVFNPGAIRYKGRYCLVCRVEGSDRKSFFAVAESDSPTEGFRFSAEPIELPEADTPATNVYDMRVVAHEDGWIYGVFCAERKDPAAPSGDTSSAVASCGIARTRDLVSWERLPDLTTPSPQQRNVVLHPVFVDGKYLVYTRPQDEFIDAGSGGGIGYGFVDSMEQAVIGEERILDPRVYHTVKEAKNGLGPAPILTDAGWLHLAHGVRNTAAGLRYVLYTFMCGRDEPWRVIRRPGGYLLAPVGGERVGDVSNVVFSNGWIPADDGRLFIYYASSDTRIHVAETTVEKLTDYTMTTAEDPLTSAGSVAQRLSLIRANRSHT